jgi:hypothetical protein
LRRYTFSVVSGTCALVFGVLSLALLDLVSAFAPGGGDASTSTAMGDMAFGVIGVVLLAPAFAAQLRRDGDRAAMHQVAAVVVALAAASVWSGEVVGVVGAIAVLLAWLVVGALHPDRGGLLRRPAQLSHARLTLGLAVVMAVPAWWYASVLAARGRAGLPPDDSFAFVPSLWSALVAMLIATSLLAALAAAGERGLTVSAWSVTIAALLFGLACVVNPDAPASGGRGWGLATIVWSGAWVLAAWASDRGSASVPRADRRSA